MTTTKIPAIPPIPTDVLAGRLDEFCRIHGIAQLSQQACDLHNLVFHGSRYPSDTGNYCESCGACLDADDSCDLCESCSRH